MSDENATGQGGEFSMEFVSPPGKKIFVERR